MNYMNINKLLLIGLLSISNAFGADQLKYPLDIMLDSPDLILFVDGHRVYRMINPEDTSDLPDHVVTNHYVAMTTPEHTWSGIDQTQIPRFVGVHVKHVSPSMQDTVFNRLINSIPESYGGFLKLNCLLETVRKSPHLSKLVFSWTMQNEKRFGVLVGQEIMKVAPDWYMEYREIVDQYAPEMQNTFELGYVWLDPQFRDLVTVPEQPSVDTGRIAHE